MNDIDVTKTSIAVALDVLAKSKQAKAEDNPLVNNDLRSLIQGRGVRMTSDHRQSLSTLPISAPRESEIKPLDKEWYADDPEGAEADYLRQWTDSAANRQMVSRRAGFESDGKDKSAKRMAVSRARARRKADMDAAANSPVVPNPVRLGKAWHVVVPLVPIIDRITVAKQRWAARYLGSLVDDVPNVVTEKIVLMLAKGDHDLDRLAIAAQELADSGQRIPMNQVPDDEKAERRRIRQARKWLMSVINNWVMNTLVDLYRSTHNLRAENIDEIATIMASISGVGEDPLVNRHKADRAPAMLGTTFPRPGSTDRTLLSIAIAGAITGRGLDALAELLLDEENRRTDGSFMWADNAERVFRLTPDGEEVWALVCLATEHVAEPRRARADAARINVRNTFEWLPSLIVEAARCFEYRQREVIYYVDGAQRALVRSEFDDYCATDAHYLLVPSLTYADVEEAASVIAEILALTFTGEDLVNSIVNA